MVVLLVALVLLALIAYLVQSHLQAVVLEAVATYPVVLAVLAVAVAEVHRTKRLRLVLVLQAKETLVVFLMLITEEEAVARVVLVQRQAVFL